MNISNLPIAINLAKPSPALTQLQVSKGTTAVPTEPSQAFTYEATLISSDKAYTKESAILKQWNKAGSFNLYDVLNGKVSTVKLQNPNPGREEPAAFEKELQENGISKEIDWGHFEFDLRGMGFRSENTGYSLNPDIFNRKTDYLASRYAAMQDKILRNTSGEETEKQMKKLDLLYSEALETFARDYSEAVGGFLDENGCSEEKEKIYQSVLSGTDKKAEAYAKYLSENPDFTNLKGTTDEWLLEDDEYVAALLREHPNVQTSSQTAVIDGSPKTEDDSYTMEELDILGRYTAELSNFDSPSAVYQMDEGRIGLDFAMLAMKTDTISANGKLSRKMEATLQKLLDGFMNGFLDRMDRQMEKKRTEAYAISDEKGFAALDRSAVWNVYNRTMEQYNTSKNVLEALASGAKYGAAQSLAKQDGTYRSQNNRSYWTNFSSDAYSKYADGWNDFQKSLMEEDGLRLHLSFGSDRLYRTPELYLGMNSLV